MGADSIAFLVRRVVREEIGGLKPMKSTDSLGRLVGLETANATKDQQVLEATFAQETDSTQKTAPTVRRGTDFLNAFPEYPDCQICKDTGLQHLPDYPPCYRWCVCPAGIARRGAEPGLVDEANARELALIGGRR